MHLQSLRRLVSSGPPADILPQNMAKKDNRRISQGKISASTSRPESDESDSEFGPPRPKRRALAQLSENIPRRFSAPEHLNKLMNAPKAFLAAATTSSNDTAPRNPRSRPQQPRQSVPTNRRSPVRLAPATSKDTAQPNTTAGSSPTARPHPRTRLGMRHVSGDVTNPHWETMEDPGTTSEDSSRSEGVATPTTHSPPERPPAVTAALAAAEALKRAAAAMNEASEFIVKSVSLSYPDRQPSPTLSPPVVATTKGRGRPSHGARGLR